MQMSEQAALHRVSPCQAVPAPQLDIRCSPCHSRALTIYKGISLLPCTYESHQFGVPPLRFGWTLFRHWSAIARW